VYCTDDDFYSRYPHPHIRLHIRSSWGARIRSASRQSPYTRTTVRSLAKSLLMPQHGACLIRLLQIQNIFFRQFSINAICKQNKFQLIPILISFNYTETVSLHALIKSSSFSILVQPTIGAVTLVNDHAKETCAMLMPRFLDISSTLIESS
jgi:hypothetical protein